MRKPTQRIPSKVRRVRESTADAIITDLAIHACEAYGEKLGGMTEDGRRWPDFWQMGDKERAAWRAAVSAALSRYQEFLSKKA